MLKKPSAKRAQYTGLFHGGTVFTGTVFKLHSSSATVFSKKPGAS